MPAPQKPNNRAQRRDQMQRLRHQGATRWWDRQDPKSIGTACVITSAGSVLIAVFVIAAITRADRYAGPLLLFGSALFLFGGLILLFALIEWIAKRFIHSQKHCGCCVFYQPQGDDYDVGMCRSDPREGYVERTHSCPYFRYSERAMVRDRLSQQRSVLHQIRILQVDSEQTGSDD